MATNTVATYPLFLDLGTPKPTTRDIAATVKQGGTAALTEAERRADEARYQEVTCRSALAAGRTPIGLVTKGPMIVRDRDVLLDVARAAAATVYMSVPTVDEDAWRSLEPGTAPPLQRLRAVRELVDAGVNAGVLMAPIVPGFSTSPSKLERTVKAIADHGARFVGCNVMYLQDGTRSHFMKFIARDFPAMAPRFEKLYAKKYPPDAYRKEVQGMLRVLQERYRLNKRGDAHDSGPQTHGAPAEPEQVGFRF